MDNKPLMEFSYHPGPHGMLYPDIQVNETPEQTQPGPYGAAWKAYMMETNPERISELLVTGQLTQVMAAVDEEAENHKEEVILSLLRKSPMPQTEDTLERAVHMDMLTREADEITRAEIVYQPR